MRNLDFFKKLNYEDGISVVTDICRRFPLQYGTTLGLDGNPQIRPLEFKFAEDGVLYFDTVELYAHRTPRVHIHIEKKIFLTAGLAGGSTDAAAVLRGLNRYWELHLPAAKLERLGAKLGSDIPFCVAGGTALATGRGEILKALPDLPNMHLALAKPPLEISTPWAYREFDKQKNVIHPDIEGMAQAIAAGDTEGVLRRCGNVLEPVTAGAHPEIREIRQRMLQNGAAAAMMSGSGPTVFGIVKDKETGLKIAGILQALRYETAVAELVGRKKV